MHENVDTQTVSDPVDVRVRYFAGARAAVGVDEETLLVSPRQAGAVTVADVLGAVHDQHDDRIAQIVPACSFLLDGVAVHDHATAVPNGAELDVLPPFAGG